jgi:exodeoxyribonuclease VII small subunit
VKKKPDADQLPADLSFEEALGELESVLDRMETGRLSLDESLAAFRRGASLLKHCQGQLDDTDAKLRILDEEVLKPFSLGNGHEA